MYIDIFVLVLLVASIVGLSLSILFIVRFYSHLVRRIEETEREKLLLHSNITQKAEEILSQAHKNNQEIITKANRDAAQILSDASNTKMSSDDLLKHKLSEMTALQEQTLKKLSDDSLASYQKTLSGMQSQDLAQVKKISDEFEVEVDKQLNEFTKTLETETLEAEKDVKTRIEHEYEKANTEIEAYKNSELAKIKEAAYPLLQNMSMLILGKSLSLDDHEKLIHDALEDAKREMSHNVSSYKNIDQKTPTPPVAKA